MPPHCVLKIGGRGGRSGGSEKKKLISFNAWVHCCHQPCYPTGGSSQRDQRQVLTTAKFTPCLKRLSTNDRLDISDCSIKTFISNLD